MIIFVGEGREKKEKRINLTNAQGLFLYNLPFPDGQFQSIAEIMKKAAIADEQVPEIIDLVNLLIDWNQNGKWGDAGEHVIVNLVVPPKYIGPLSGLTPPNFAIGQQPGFFWIRFSLTEKPVATKMFPVLYSSH